MEMEAAGKLEENKKLTILPILYESCNVTDFLQDRILIDFTDPDRYRLSFEALLNRLLDLPLPVYMTAKEAARLIKVTCDPNGGLCGLSQQGICQQITYEPIRLRGDWYYADVKTGKSTIWILEYYDPLPQNLYTYSVIDGKVDTLASGKLDSSMRVVDFNFIDSDIAVSIALKETRSILPALLENNTYFVDTMMKYCGPIDDYLWFVIFYDLTLTNITYIVEVDPYNGKVSRSYKPPENRLKPRS
jgi:hypothetical protein